MRIFHQMSSAIAFESGVEVLVSSGVCRVMAVNDDEYIA